MKEFIPPPIKSTTPEPPITQNKAGTPKSTAGKGDSPRNIWSDNFKDNWEAINWSIPSEKPPKAIKGSIKTTYVYR
jgi:hypothetical protein